MKTPEGVNGIVYKWKHLVFESLISAISLQSLGRMLLVFSWVGASAFFAHWLKGYIGAPGVVIGAMVGFIVASALSWLIAVIIER